LYKPHNLSYATENIVSDIILAFPGRNTLHSLLWFTRHIYLLQVQ